MTPRPGLLRWSKIKNYKGSNALRVTWSPPPGFSICQIQTSHQVILVFYEHDMRMEFIVNALNLGRGVIETFL